MAKSGTGWVGLTRGKNSITVVLDMTLWAWLLSLSFRLLEEVARHQ